MKTNGTSDILYTKLIILYSTSRESEGTPDHQGKLDLLDRQYAILPVYSHYVKDWHPCAT